MTHAAHDVKGRGQRVSAWTGGQFSLVRALTGLALLAHFAMGAHGDASAVLLGSLGGAAALGMGLGFRTRWCAIAAVLAWIAPALVAGGSPLNGAPLSGAPSSGASWLAEPWLAAPLILACLAMAVAPAAPFGSWDGRGRVDPAGAWRLASWVTDTIAGALALWLILGGAVGAGLLQGDPTAAPFGGRGPWAALGACAGLLLWVSRRAGGTWALAGWGTSLGLLAVASVASAPPVALALPALLLAWDPRWLPDPSEGWVDTVFYDGSCGLCHGAVRWLLAEDPEGARFRYAPLGGEAFLAAVAPARRSLLPDSILVRTPEGALLDRSAAVGRLLSRLGGLWGLLGLAWGCLPRGLGDLAYAAVARVRHRLVEAPSGTCPLLTPDLGRRFAP